MKLPPASLTAARTFTMAHGFIPPLWLCFASVARTYAKWFDIGPNTERLLGRALEYVGAGKQGAAVDYRAASAGRVRALNGLETRPSIISFR
jgi:hypothetical protein